MGVGGFDTVVYPPPGPPCANPMDEPYHPAWMRDPEAQRQAKERQSECPVGAFKQLTRADRKRMAVYHGFSIGGRAPANAETDRNGQQADRFLRSTVPGSALAADWKNQDPNHIWNAKFMDYAVWNGPRLRHFKDILVGSSWRNDKMRNQAVALDGTLVSQLEAHLERLNSGRWAAMQSKVARFMQAIRQHMLGSAPIPHREGIWPPSDLKRKWISFEDVGKTCRGRYSCFGWEKCGTDPDFDLITEQAKDWSVHLNLGVNNVQGAVKCRTGIPGYVYKKWVLARVSAADRPLVEKLYDDVHVKEQYADLYFPCMV